MFFKSPKINVLPIKNQKKKKKNIRKGPKLTMKEHTKLLQVMSDPLQGLLRN